MNPDMIGIEIFMPLDILKGVDVILRCLGDFPQT